MIIKNYYPKTWLAFKYYEESLQLLKEIYKIHPYTATVSLKLARLWSKSNDKDEALEYKLHFLFIYYLFIGSA